MVIEVGMNLIKIKAVVVIFLFLFGCASTDIQSAQRLSDEQGSQQKNTSKNSKNMKISQLQNELFSVNTQITGLDGMIGNSHARIQHYQFMEVMGKAGIIAGAQAELTGYEAQKNGLLARRTQIQGEIDSQQ